MTAKQEFDHVIDDIHRGYQKEIILLKNELADLKLLLSQHILSQSSIGNKGVQSLTHAFANHQMQDTQSLSALKQPNFEVLSQNNQVDYTKDLFREDQSHQPQHPIFEEKASKGSHAQSLNELFATFERLTKQELRVFLAIYVLEEMKNNWVTYEDISKKLNLSDSGARSYVSKLFRLGLPLIKKKLNDHSTVLRVAPEFLKLNQKKDLMDLWYEK